jgi:cobalt transport protein
MRLRNLVFYILAAACVAALPYLWTLAPSTANALGNGTDDKARKAIEEVSPAYRPWAESFWRPSSPEMERSLFTVQALAGTLVFLAVVRILRKKSESGK